MDLTQFLPLLHKVRFRRGPGGRLREGLRVLWVALETIAHRTLLGVREMACLGRFGWYWRLRAALSAGEPAWRLARREGPATGVSEEDLTYGETPLLTAWEILRELGADDQDTVVDLGCGQGQVVLLARLAFGCRGLGVEVVPPLVERSRRMARGLGLEGVEFQLGDFRELAVASGTIYFLCPTTLQEASWAALIQRLQGVPVGARAVCLSTPIPNWEVTHQSRRAYSWGWSTVYLQRKTKSDRETVFQLA